MPQVRLFDTARATPVVLDDLCPDRQVSFYSCGPTVYDYPHLGNWYAFLRWDLLVRFLKLADFKVNWVMNITDVGHLVSDADDGEDKLVAASRRQRRTAWDLAQIYSDYFIDGLKRLNFIGPDHLPKATDFISQQIDFVQKLEASGLSYRLDDGLYYDTSRWPDYGRWRTDPAQVKPAPTGPDRPRIRTNSAKRQAADFALWKFSPTDSQRDMEWSSPWGSGFPGWHLECSVMCHHFFGPTVTIHAGGIDHIPIHHTNEIATSEALFKLPLARIWLHANFVLVEGQKMSKSLKNCYLLEDLINRGYHLAEFRLAVLASGYRSQADFSWAIMPAARSRYSNLLALAALRFQASAAADGVSFDRIDQIKVCRDQILAGLSDDLNSPAALTALDRFLVRVLDQPWPQAALADLEDFIDWLDQLFGLKLAATVSRPRPDQNQLLSERLQSRLRQDYQSSDQLRKQLDESGLTVNDVGQAQVWRPRIIKPKPAPALPI